MKIAGERTKIADPKAISILLAKQLYEWIRPYSVECTRSRSISEVKQLQAGLVLGWVTAWEYPVPYPFVYNSFPGITASYVWYRGDEGGVAVAENNTLSFESILVR